jgi:hypothetical protein
MEMEVEVEVEVTVVGCNLERRCVLARTAAASTAVDTARCSLGGGGRIFVWCMYSACVLMAEDSCWSTSRQGRGQLDRCDGSLAGRRPSAPAASAAAALALAPAAGGACRRGGGQVRV